MTLLMKSRLLRQLASEKRALEYNEVMEIEEMLELSSTVKLEERR